MQKICKSARPKNPSTRQQPQQLYKLRIMHTRRTNINSANATDATDVAANTFTIAEVVWCTLCRCGMTGSQVVVSHNVQPINMCMKCTLGSITSSEYSREYRQMPAREYLKHQQDAFLFVEAAESTLDHLNHLNHQQQADNGQSEYDSQQMESLLNSICCDEDVWAADLSSALSIEEDMD